ncbi:hypothetical protein BKA62DRAFT_706306 [Auriculariales sp. MPI-PUGE-AT-0066]|nr:hypothetical protein BKA62DRAFT_706306 [Auriculariales sp. MPI-PUGE-AT-0066]
MRPRSRSALALRSHGRGETFTLFQDQIEFDAPNYFSMMFLGDFAEPRRAASH